jgi:hypothetical protein
LTVYSFVKFLVFCATRKDIKQTEYLIFLMSEWFIVALFDCPDLTPTKVSEANNFGECGKSCSVE